MRLFAQIRGSYLGLCKVLVLFLLAVGHGFGQTGIPDTPSGRTLRAWLDALNSGDRAKVEAYAQTFNPAESVERMLAVHNETGGLELLAIESSEPLSITFRVKERTTSRIGIGSLRVNDSEPPVVQTFELRPTPPGAVVENIKLDATTRERVIDGVATNLKEFYVYPEAAQKMVDSLRASLKRGEYDGITNGYEFGAMLTKDLQDESHDKHLRVSYSPFKLPAAEHAPSPDEEARFRKMLEQANCGFQKVDILAGNIGYLKFDMFADPTFCGSTAVAAMNFLAHANVIIFDLRENGGGDPKMIAFISSYLFDKPTHLNDLYNRKDDATTQYWTLPFVPGNTMPNTPVFVLTSKGTFSGAEEFAYNLKNLKRAIIVGETTGGGAHPVAGHRIDDHFTIGVPFARAINPISKTNWEGIGVEPDVRAKASEALETAEKLAASKLHTN
jgi:retinol-binding protein 3